MSAQRNWTQRHRARCMNALKRGGVVMGLLVVLTLQAFGREEPPPQVNGDAGKGTLGNPATSDYAAVLKQFVNDQGMVNYKALKAGRQPLDRYVQSLAALDPNAYAQWNNEQKIAFWLNAYNGLTLLRIIDHYPIKKSGQRFPESSIRQIAGSWDEIKFAVMGKPMTLNEIEHGTLRKQFDEPRIHLALVCAARGCPPLRVEPYVGDRLDEQLNDQAQKFLSNPAKFRIDRKSNTVYLSIIFRWFGSDFVLNYNTGQFGKAPAGVRPVLEFVSQHVCPQDAEYLKTANYRIEYLDYDWLFNEQA